MARVRALVGDPYLSLSSATSLSWQPTSPMMSKGLWSERRSFHNGLCLMVALDVSTEREEDLVEPSPEPSSTVGAGCVIAQRVPVALDGGAALSAHRLGHVEHDRYRQRVVPLGER
jgi:hypothetical protein